MGPVRFEAVVEVSPVALTASSLSKEPSFEAVFDDLVSETGFEQSSVFFGRSYVALSFNFNFDLAAR